MCACMHRIHEFVFSLSLCLLNIHVYDVNLETKHSISACMCTLYNPMSIWVGSEMYICKCNLGCRVLSIFCGGEIFVLVSVDCYRPVCPCLFLSLISPPPFLSHTSFCVSHRSWRLGWRRCCEQTFYCCPWACSCLFGKVLRPHTHTPTHTRKCDCFVVQMIISFFLFQRMTL